MAKPEFLNVVMRKETKTNSVMDRLSLYSIQAVLLLDDSGQRIYAKYYHPPHESQQENSLSVNLKKQKEFEASLFKRTHHQNLEILLLDDCLVLYKDYSTFSLYLIGSIDENEIVLQQSFNSIRDSLELILNTGIDKKSIQDNYDMVELAINESIDGGIILETDAATIASRVTKPPTKDIPINIELSEKGLLNAWGFAKSKLAERLQQGL